jgi:hypothetical protein
MYNDSKKRLTLNLHRKTYVRVIQTDALNLHNFDFLRVVVTSSIHCALALTSMHLHRSLSKAAGLPDFSSYKIPKRKKYTKLPRTIIPNVHKV